MADRREKVTLELTDRGYSTGMVKAAAATGLLERALKSLDGTTVNIHERISESATSVDSLNRSARNADGSINQLTGRLRVLGEVAAILGPTIAPLGGVAIAGVGGLANQLGIAAVAGGVLIGAMQGVGDALGAMNKAQLEPTEKNLQKAKDALQALSPAAREFSYEAFRLKPALIALRDLGAEELMPGLTASLDNLEDLGPRVAGIMRAFGDVLGDIAEDSSASLASERWAGFFEFIQAEGPSTLQALATTVGDLTHGLAELWEAFTPLNNDFSAWLMDVADGFDDWASGLAGTEGFAEFIDYVRTTGPQVADTLGAIASAAIQIVQAAAPLAGPVLAGIEGAAKAIGAIADSDLGTPIFAGVAALSLLNRTLAVTASLSKVSLSSGLFAGLGTVTSGAKKGSGSIRSLGGDLGVLSRNYLTAGTASERMAAQNKKALDGIKGTARAVGPAAGLMGGLAIASTGAADSLGVTNTVSLALAGSLAGPVGIAVGAGAGALLDFMAASDGATASIDGLSAAIQSGDAGVLADQIAAAKAELTELSDIDFDVDELAFSFKDSFGGRGRDEIRQDIEAAEQALADLEQQEKLAGIAAKGAALDMLIATDANVDLGKWAGKSTEAIKAQAAALTKAQESADQTANSFVTLGESLDDGKVSLSDWIKEMADSAEALRNFTANSRTAAKRGLNDGLIESLQQAGEVGARRMRQLANATDEEIGKANRAWKRGQQAIKEYNDYKVPPKKVTADTSRAMQSFREVDVAMDGLANRPPVVLSVITAYSTTGRQVNPDGPFRPGLADGGTVPGKRSPYGDKIHAMLAPGEEIISNRFGQADQFRADRDAGRIPGYADGGTTGKRGKRKAVGGLFVSDNTSALEQAIARLTEVQEIQTGAVERDIATRDEWAARMADVAAGTISGFSTGLFAKDSNPWAAGSGGGAIANLTKDIAGLGERSALQSQLAGMGLSGDALAALLGEGSNANISALISSGQVGQYASLYAQRAALQGSVGSAAGQQAYGSQFAVADQTAKASLAAAQNTAIAMAGVQGQLAQHTKLLERMNADWPERVGNASGSAVRNEAAQAHRTKSRGGLT